MRYMGGKVRIAKYLVPVLQERLKDKDTRLRQSDSNTICKVVSRKHTEKNQEISETLSCYRTWRRKRKDTSTRLHMGR